MDDDSLVGRLRDIEQALLDAGIQEDGHGKLSWVFRPGQLEVSSSGGGERRRLTMLLRQTVFLIDDIQRKREAAEGRLRTVEALIGEMRTIAMVAGQASVEGPRDFLARQAAKEAERATRWANQLEAALRPLLQEVQPEPTEQPRPDRLTLNAYGRACYRAGERSAYLRLSETTQPSKEEHNK
jgi:hypothetical protein